MVVISGSYKALPPKFTAAAASIFPQGKFCSDEERWATVFDYFDINKDGRLISGNFLTKLLELANNKSHWPRSSPTSDSKLDIETLESWKDYPEAWEIYRTMIVRNYNQVGTLQEFTTAFFRFIGRLATNNPNQTSFSKEEFIKFNKEWKNLLKLGQ